MEIVVTEQARKSLDDSLLFLNITLQLPFDKAVAIREKVFEKIETLRNNPEWGQSEILLTPNERRNRRLIEGYYKIVYYIQNDCIYVTDIFDSRQHPSRMKG